MTLGVWEVAVILLIVLIIFGAGKLPKVMGDVAKGIKNFKSEMNGGETPEAAPPPVTAATTAPMEAAAPTPVAAATVAAPSEKANAA